ncbi:cytochrome b6 [Leptolyngbya sp. Heron Island J]|uniref:cytochrome b N-terminal domain-containing protein n=1 Tax=Leptolyngbya sp. Heron Island J TaxID=1385935 RepID=UPI0003B97A40|nr:cytochrome b N-terminal domain-containing protein [Leptolyngbya sp. Heron Island J]ESA35661.1 cytochrome b6 [Leptolyngbya sp. Heron Island J]
MDNQDVKLAGKVAKFINRFPDDWQKYQDWLRAIMSSRSVLLERYPAWQATMIFRWRLFYFMVYVASGIFWSRLRRYAHKQGAWRTVDGETVGEQPVIRGQYRYILQRVATLLAMVELTLCGIAALTGVMLAFYYQPTALGAYTSLKMIVNNVANGALILSLHNVAGDGLIVFALIQIVVMFLGREFLLSWFTAWISGIGLALTAMALSWTAVVLAWEQTGFWRLKIELNILGSLPWVGPTLRDILSGGSGISSFTLQHMYMLHSYVLAIAAILISITHLTALIFQEQQWQSAERSNCAANPK